MSPKTVITCSAMIIRSRLCQQRQAPASAPATRPTPAPAPPPGYMYAAQRVHVPAAVAAPNQAVADWSLCMYFIYGLVTAILGLLVKKLASK